MRRYAILSSGGMVVVAVALAAIGSTSTPRQRDIGRLRQELDATKARLPLLEDEWARDRASSQDALRPKRGIAHDDAQIGRWRAISKKSQERVEEARRAIIELGLRIRELEAGIEEPVP